MQYDAPNLNMLLVTEIIQNIPNPETSGKLTFLQSNWSEVKFIYDAYISDISVYNCSFYLTE